MGDADVTYTGVDLTYGTPGQIDILVSPKAGLVFGRGAGPNSRQ